MTGVDEAGQRMAFEFIDKGVIPANTLMLKSIFD